LRGDNCSQRPDMALWPPSFVNCDKSSLSAGAIKVSDSHCAMKIKDSHAQVRAESTSVSWRYISGMFSRDLEDD
jgi:hypothetical protein